VREPFVELLWKPMSLAFMVGTAMIVAGGPRAIHRDAWLLFVAAGGFVPAFVLMGKGWTYHSWPFLALGAMGLLLQILQTERPADLPPVRKAAALIGFLFVLLVPLATQVHVHVAPRIDTLAVNRRAAAAIVATAIDRPRIATVSAIPQSVHPLVRMAGGRFVSRHPSAWAIGNAEVLIATTDDAAQRARLVPLRDALIAEFAAELAAKRPDIVVYDIEPHYFQSTLLPGTGAVSWPRLMLNNPAIAKELAGYRLLHREGSVSYLIRADIGRRG
jgi:hypothetical protein